MASWLQHPRYIPIREGLIDHLRQTRYRFRKLDPVVFLCGGRGSKSRDALRDYFHKYRPGLDVFYAEPVWENIARLGERDALQMEADLAKLADLIIIIVESAGTFTELGAFSSSPELRQKLLPIVDQHHENDVSFIKNGPLQWVDKESHFKPTIFASLDSILTAVDQIDERVERIPPTHSLKVADLSTSPKHLIFFICDLVSVIYPATLEAISYYLGTIAPSILSSEINIPTLVGLAVAMDLLRPFTLSESEGARTYYAPADPTGIKRPFHHSRLLYLEGKRAEHASVLLAIPQAREVLEHFGKAS